MRALSIAVCLALAGCGGSTGTAGPDSGLPRAHPKISVSPLKLDFGLVTTAFATKTLRVENVGDGPLTLGLLKMSSPLQFEATLRGDIRIGAGSFAEIDVKFISEGYGSRQATLTISSNDEDVTVELSGETTAPEPCEFEVAPSSLAFEEIAVSATKELSLTLRATKGVCPLIGAGLTANTNAAFTLPEGIIGTRMLTVGETVTVPVRVKAPMISGAVMGSVLVLVEGQAQLSVSLNANVVNGDCLTLTPDDFDFGTVQRTCPSAAVSVTLSNRCAQSVTIEAVTLNADFLISTGTPLSAGAVIGPSGSAPRVVHLYFEPTKYGTIAGALILKSTQYGGTVDNYVTLRGSGEGYGPIQNKFTEELPPKVDTLFVIDNSPSMAAYQANTAANLGRAFDVLGTIDSHFAITTMDLANAGKIIGDATNPKVIASSTPNAKAKFLQKFAQLPVTTENPPALEVTTAAVSPAQLMGDNAGLMRPGSFHSIFVITNTDDHSPLPVASYITGLQGHALTVIARLGAVPGCNVVGIGLGAPRLLDASAGVMSGGGQGDLCHPTWSDLFGFAVMPPPPRTTFYLTSTPKLQTLTVTFNGALLPGTSATGANQWAYDPNLNAVVFDPAFALLPGPGPSHITLDYLPTCF